MNFPFLVARRYFRSKKKKNFIQIISNISMIGVAVGTMALVVVLSVFNGLEDLIKESKSTFDPEIKIVPVFGKTLLATDSLLNVVQQVKGVDVVTQVIEDNAIARYQDAQMIVTLKGVSDNFVQQQRLSQAMIHGDLTLAKDDINYAIMGQGVQYTLSIAPSNEFYTMQLLTPRQTASSSGFNPDPMNRYFKRKNIMPGGVFANEKEYDASYVIVPMRFAQQLFDYGEERTALEIKTDDNVSVSRVESQLEKLLPAEEYQVLNSDEQHASLLRAVKWEKLFVYVTFSFILAIASFNIFFSLSMLAIDKRKDIAMLFAMGAQQRTVKSIFLFEGVIIALLGAGSGLLAAVIICWVQQTFGIVSMGMQTAIVDAYPVKMELADFLFTALSISLITFLASYRPAIIASRTDVKDFL
ncbi:FtsX-like permease family protein [Tunicatimonas pelagia]|uniref:FtsX-like permease family protein n=1 Tax=Tunicatimonas pelagia TaxID=931531 RepID=UPI0026655A77|nr:FtsX-like permease family protein [Tunicatimonas pelagia]WKN40822.1 FtsX-like permease family protein [Tunicatimonas pelagia]